MQPTLAELTTRFLNQPWSESAGGEVEPYDVLSAFRVEPRTAWSETLVVLKSLGVGGPFPAMSAEWSGQVRQQAAVRFLPMSVGTYPQMVSDMSHLLAEQADSTTERVVPIHIQSLQPLLNDSARRNEEAVKLWLLGQSAASVAMWSTMLNSPVKAFNLGLSHLVSRELRSAITQLTLAAKSLPEESGWLALANLYLAFARSEHSDSVEN